MPTPEPPRHCVGLLLLDGETILRCVCGATLRFHIAPHLAVWRAAVRAFTARHPAS